MVREQGVDVGVDVGVGVSSERRDGVVMGVWRGSGCECVCGVELSVACRVVK